MTSSSPDGPPATASIAAFTDNELPHVEKNAMSAPTASAINCSASERYPFDISRSSSPPEANRSAAKASGPITSRVRALFVKHTRTGNPLVDSVAEHQPANAQAYEHYLHHVYKIAPYGLGACAFRWSDANLFIVLYALTH